MYDIKIVLSKTNFTDLKAESFSLYCSDFEGQIIISINYCSFTGEYRNMQYKPKIVRFRLKECYNRLGNKENEINLNHCMFSNNRLQNKKGTLLDFYISVLTVDPWINIERNLMISILDCVFHNNHNLQTVKVFYSRSDYGFVVTPVVLIERIEISNLKLAKNSYSMYFNNIEVYLKGPAVLKYIKSSDDKSVIIKASGLLQFENYVEISFCVVPFAVQISRIYIAEYSTINFTANKFDTLIFNKQFQSYPELLIASPRLLKSCIFQYSSNRGNLDKEFESGENLTYFILFNSNDIERLSRYKYGVVHCGWSEDSAYIASNPRFVNQKVIHYMNDSLEHKKIRKDIVYVIINLNMVVALRIS